VSVLTIAALALGGCVAVMDVDDFTFHATPFTNGGAAGAAVTGDVGAGGRVGGGGSGGVVEPPVGAPPIEGGAAGSPAQLAPGPSVEPAPAPDAAAPLEPPATVPGEPPLASVVAALEDLPRASSGFLRPTEVVVVGSPLRSRNDHVELRLERDQLTVTHQRVDGVRVVVATVPLTNAHLATLAEDGHFVIFSRDGSITDISNSAGSVTNPTLRVQNDGNVVLYDNDAILPRAARWATGTNFRRIAGACRRLEPNQVVYPAETQPLSSCNGLFRLVMDAEGRLSVIDLQNVPVLQTATGGGPESITIMQRDGNLVVYDVDDVPRWSTGTFTVPGAYAALEDDGTLAVFAPNDVRIWPPAQ
jgi:hypothetical protein